MDSDNLISDVFSFFVASENVKGWIQGKIGNKPECHFFWDFS